MSTRVTVPVVVEAIQRWCGRIGRHIKSMCWCLCCFVLIGISASANEVTTQIIRDDEGNILEEKLTLKVDREKKPHTLEELRDALEAHRKGNELYEKEQYAEAYPYLLKAAKIGFKDSQARLGFILLHGVDGVPPHHARAIGWLSAASTGKTKPVVKRYYEMLVSAVPSSHAELINKVATGYAEKYGRSEPVVTCRTARFTSSYIKRMKCFFTDIGLDQVGLAGLEFAEYLDLEVKGPIEGVGNQPVIVPIGDGEVEILTGFQ